MPRDGLLPFPEGGAPRPGARLVPVIEAMLFAVGEPVTIGALAEALGGADPIEVELGLERLAERCRRAESGVEVVQVAKGWQLRTRPRYGADVLRLKGGRPAKLSRAALEVLATVAYQQPATRGDIDAVRGVDSGGVLRSLLQRGLVRVTGRRKVPGRPLVYGTTDAFLELFSLPDLASMPTLREREELERDTPTTEPDP